MPFGLLGKKLGMIQLFDSDGTVIPVTVVEAGPCTVVQKKSSKGRDGYDALVLAYDEVPERKVRKPQLGTYKKAGVNPHRHLREIRVQPEVVDSFEVGQTLTLTDGFQVGTLVDVTAKSKGRGFAGVMRRYGFAGSPAGHGTHEFFRHGGSIGCANEPGKIVKGRKMPGQYGNKRITVQNLKVVDMVTSKNLMLIQGSVPGPAGSVVLVRGSIKLEQKLIADAL